MRVEVIGIGAGDPKHVTIEAVDVLNTVDVFFFLDKPGARRELSDLRQNILDRHVTRPYRVVRMDDPERDRTSAGYVEAVADWRRRRVDLCEKAIGELGADEIGAFLVWGDPALYDSIIAVVEDVRARGTVSFDVGVVAGISSVSALAARHQISITQVAGAVQVTTGRRLAQGWPEGVDDVVVMLDAQCAFLAFVGDPDMRIHWGAYLGTADEILISGRLADVAGHIEQTRERARREKGWIMDTYLLRRSPRPARPGSAAV